MLMAKPLADPYAVVPAAPAEAADIARWREGVRERAEAALASFVRTQCAEYVREFPGADTVRELLGSYVSGGKYVRPTFAYLGWLCGADESDAALRAAASSELLHAFALLQDDVMDQSALRRGRAAAHVRLGEWYTAHGLTGDARRFGQSAAILLSDLLLVWAERMLRESGLDADVLARGWPVYDRTRSELAVGQFADLVYDARHLPPMEVVLEMSRRKSGNYTVRRPLELGAALAGCARPVSDALGRYGGLVGEAFQLRDDLLGIFGRPSATGKPNSGDLREHKATSVIVLAAEMAGPAARAELAALYAQDRLSAPGLARARELIVGTGAVERIERMIKSRVTAASASLSEAGIDGFVLRALCDLAHRATCRDR
jgi:geranylgeranyl diphosphate synthase, type I